MSPERAPVERRTSLKLVAGWIRRREEDAHKGSVGRVLIVAGSRGMAGAAVLTAMGAARSGAGLVKVASVRSQQPLIARRAPIEATCVGLPEDSAGMLSPSAWGPLRRILEEYRPDVIAVGPGLGTSAGVKAIVRKILFGQNVPVVLDADGLNALSDSGMKGRFRPTTVMTPHPGEMARLLGATPARVQKDRAGSVLRAAKLFGAIVLLKGAGTLVSDGRRIFRNSTGGPAMASGGMGDVLTGILAATLAQESMLGREGAFRAAISAAFIHGLAGDLAVGKFPERTLLASDVARELPGAFGKIWHLKVRGGHK